MSLEIYLPLKFSSPGNNTGVGCHGGKCPPPRDFPDPGIDPMFPMSPALAGGFFTTSAIWEALNYYANKYYSFKVTEAGRHTFLFLCNLKCLDLFCLRPSEQRR